MADNKDEGAREFDSDVDPLTENRFTAAQEPSKDEEIRALPETEDGIRTGDFDTTTGAAHPTADSGADKGVEEK